jgi:hypothetical protein
MYLSPALLNTLRMVVIHVAATPVARHDHSLERTGAARLPTS